LPQWSPSSKEQETMGQRPGFKLLIDLLCAYVSQDSGNYWATSIPQ
uniref:Neuromedin-B n=1 Tax=Hymenolepis diminuta TaxID=6216 RepID=A0A0R3SF34_HYMDI